MPQDISSLYAAGKRAGGYGALATLAQASIEVRVHRTKDRATRAYWIGYLRAKRWNSASV